MLKVPHSINNRGAVSGLTLILVLAILTLSSPWLSPRNPAEINLRARLQAPSRDFPLGTDNLGRCVLSRTLSGGRISLLAGLSVTGAALAVGMLIGLFSGLSGGKIDGLLMRLTDIALAFPMLILAIVIAGILGPSMKSTIIGLFLANWPWWARFIRGLTITANEKEFVLGGRVAGVGGFRLVCGYILPQLAPAVLVAASLSVGGMIVAVSGLSFLGLGAKPPTPEWGVMLKEAGMYMIHAPWMMIAPGLGVTLSVLGFNLLGEGMRDALQIRDEVRPY